MGLFGIGDGVIDFQLKNKNVAFGEAVEGTVKLTINTDVKGRQVVATLYAERTETTINPQGQPVTKKFQIYTKSEQLDTEKLYTKQSSPYQYNISFVIPQTSETQQDKGTSAGVLGNLLGGLGGAQRPGSSSGLTRWYVKVEFQHETMLSFPLEKTEEINIVLHSQQPLQPQQPSQQPQQPVGGQS